jgi:hypothetical protein
VDEHELAEVRSLADAIEASRPPGVMSEGVAPIFRLAELSRALADEMAAGPRPVQINLNVAGDEAFVRFVSRVSGAAGRMRALDDDDMQNYPLHPKLRRAIADLGLALQYLEAGQ